MTTELLPAFDLDDLHCDSVSPSLRPRFNALLQDEDFVGASTRRDQIGVAMCSLREDEDKKLVAFSVLSVFFGTVKTSIEWQARRYHGAIRGNGRLRTLPEAAYTYITEVIQVRFTEKKPVTYRLFQDAIEWHFQLSMPTDTLHHICRGRQGCWAPNGSRSRSMPPKSDGRAL
jgi:hypothetical protein